MSILSTITKTPLLSLRAFSAISTYNYYLQNYELFDKNIINPSGKKDLITKTDLGEVLKSSDNSQKPDENNETIGQSAEAALSFIYNLDCSINSNRTNNKIINKIKDSWLEFGNNHKIPFKLSSSIGYKNGISDFYGIDSKNNKCSISLKTTKKSYGKICPQKIGQTTYKKWDEYFQLPVDIDDEYRFNYIKSNIRDVLQKYIQFTFCCDYLIIISNCSKIPKVQLINKPNISFSDIKSDIIFTRDYNRDKSSFSTTVKIKNNKTEEAIGEFQFHRKNLKKNKGRDVLKFRFFSKFLISMNSQDA